MVTGRGIAFHLVLLVLSVTFNTVDRGIIGLALRVEAGKQFYSGSSFSVASSNRCSWADRACSPPLQQYCRMQCFFSPFV